MTHAPKANDLVGSIHPHMPVILHESDFDLWLNPEVRKAELLTELFERYPAEGMASHQVGASANKPTTDAPEVINPL